MITNNEGVRNIVYMGKFNYEVYLILRELNNLNAKIKIREMGDKWCLHKNNKVKRLTNPLRG